MLSIDEGTLEGRWKKLREHSETCPSCRDPIMAIRRQVTQSQGQPREEVLRILTHCCESGQEMGLRWDESCQEALDGSPTASASLGTLSQRMVDLRRQRERQAQEMGAVTIYSHCQHCGEIIRHPRAGRTLCYKCGGK